MNRVVRLNTGRGYRIAMKVHLLTHPSKSKRVVVVAHGLGQDSNAPLMREIDETLIGKRYSTIHFDFAGHGESGGRVKDRRVGNFIRDIDDVIEWIRRQMTLPASSVAVVGYSIGALVGILYGAQNGHHLAGIAAIASNSDADGKFLQLEASGKLKHRKLYDVIGRTKVSRNFWKERRAFDVQKAVSKIECSTLFVCGENDTTNSPEESRELYREALQPKYFSIIPHEDHYFKTRRGRTLLLKKLIVWLDTLH